MKNMRRLKPNSPNSPMRCRMRSDGAGAPAGVFGRTGNFRKKNKSCGELKQISFSECKNKEGRKGSLRKLKETIL